MVGFGALAQITFVKIGLFQEELQQAGSQWLITVYRY